MGGYSVILMMALDGLIVLLTGAAIIFFVKNAEKFRAAKLQWGARAILLGLGVFGLFFLCDFIVMYIFPLFMPMVRAMSYVHYLHTEVSWFVNSFSVLFIVLGSLHVTRCLFLSSDMTETALAELASQKLAMDEHAIVAATDTSGTITYVNEKFCQISKYDRDELIGSNHRILNSGHHPKSFFADMYRTIANGGAWHGEIKNRSKDGSHYWVDTTIMPFKNAAGKIVEYVAIRADITGRKRAESELIHRRDHLQELVDAATSELKIREVDLQQALAKEKELSELQRQFVTMASHEFRTPLAIIDGSVQRLKSRAEKGDLTLDDTLKRVDKIRDAVKRMTRLMESTLTAACMEEGKIKVMIESCDIGKVVKEICARQQEVIENHVISCDLINLPKTIQADADSLEQVLNNLLSNAVKYAPDAPDIEVKAHTEGHQVVISVRDRGIGIDEDDLHRIGERFFRAKTSTGTAGTGIGLNLVKMLVGEHGGTVNTESKKGEGSTFTVSLPIAGPNQSQQADTRAA